MKTRLLAGLAAMMAGLHHDMQREANIKGDIAGIIGSRTPLIGQASPTRGYNFYPPRVMNQRQKRKRWRQTPHTRLKK